MNPPGTDRGPRPEKIQDSLSAVPTVFIVTANRAMRESLQGLVSDLGYAAKSFPDAESFLRHFRRRPHACVILDLALPKMSGMELLETLHGMAPELPVIAIGDSYDVTSAVGAMQRGAVDYFEKPFVDRALISRLEETIL